MAELKKLHIMTSPDTMNFHPDLESISAILPDDDFDYYIFPGFTDVHVHMREPGFSYKETIRTGTMAAARGGYTCVCAMPNLNPVPDSTEHLREEQEIIDRDAVVEVLPYASITVGEKGQELVDFEALSERCIAFSDDGKGVQSEEMMREAMKKAKACNKMIVAHCEVDSMLHGGYIHDGAYAKAHGHRGISSESEWAEIERDVRLSGETGCAFHACHISTKESVEIIRKGKAAGLNISCETGPHYLVMDENDLQEDGWFKMNPPLRGTEDREALIKGIQDGTIDCIATDHAPHSAEEKAKGLEKSAFGIVGLETAFPLLYTRLVRTGVISLEALLKLLTTGPRKRFGLPETQDFTVWRLDEKFTVDPDEFLSMGKAQPFTGMELYGRCMLTVHDGKILYRREEK